MQLIQYKLKHVEQTKIQSLKKSSKIVNVTLQQNNAKND